MRKYSRRFAKENCRLLVTRALGCNAVLRDTPKNHGEGNNTTRDEIGTPQYAESTAHELVFSTCARLRP